MSPPREFTKAPPRSRQPFSKFQPRRHDGLHDLRRGPCSRTPLPLFAALSRPLRAPAPGRVNRVRRRGARRVNRHPRRKALVRHQRTIGVRRLYAPVRRLAGRVMGRVRAEGDSKQGPRRDGAWLEGDGPRAGLRHEDSPRERQHRRDAECTPGRSAGHRPPRRIGGQSRTTPAQPVGQRARSRHVGKLRGCERTSALIQAPPPSASSA